MRPAVPVASGRCHSAESSATPVCWASPASMAWPAQMCCRSPESTAPAQTKPIKQCSLGMGCAMVEKVRFKMYVHLYESPEVCLRAQTRPHPPQRSAHLSGAVHQAAPVPCCPSACLHHHQPGQVSPRSCLAGECIIANVCRLASAQPTFLPHDLISCESRSHEADCQQLNFLTGSIAVSIQRPQALCEVHYHIVGTPLLFLPAFHQYIVSQRS